MSAAAQPTPQADRPPVPIKAVCRVPQSYFRQMLEICNFAEVVCFGLILDSTVGDFDKPWAEISDEQFGDAGVISRDWILESLSRLERYGYIRQRKSERGRREYTVCDKVRLECSVKGHRFVGRCTKCSHEDVYDSHYVAVPHAYFRKLGACLDHAAYVCLGVIMEQSLRWTGDEGITTKFAELDLNDFTRAGGFESASSVTKALSRLCDPDGWGLVERIQRPGKPALYRAIPERFNQIQRREARVIIIDRPAKANKPATTTDAGVSVKAPKSAKSIGIESVSRWPGFCPKCESWVELEPVEGVLAVPKQASPPPRKEPGREKAPPGQQKATPAFERRQESRKMVVGLAKILGESRRRTG